MAADRSRLRKACSSGVDRFGESLGVVFINSPLVGLQADLLASLRKTGAISLLCNCGLWGQKIVSASSFNKEYLL